MDAAKDVCKAAASCAKEVGIIGDEKFRMGIKLERTRRRGKVTRGGQKDGGIQQDYGKNAMLDAAPSLTLKTLSVLRLTRFAQV